MSKSVLVMNTPENCYDCPFGTAYCGELEYVGYCELAGCLDYDVILMTEEHYDCESKSRPEWCPLMDLPEKDNGDYLANTFDAGFVEGRNQCIDEITGGEVDEKRTNVALVKTVYVETLFYSELNVTGTKKDAR